ncbi:MAG: beta-ketoacyl-[acyl-carrier-protein] synthase family protein [Acidobacteriota bacterium]
MKRRVAVVSVGALSPLGPGWTEFKEGIFEHKDWFSPLPEGLPYPDGAAVDDGWLDAFYRKPGRRFKYRRYYNRATDMAVAATFECLERVESFGIDLRELAVFWGAGPNFDMGNVPGHATPDSTSRRTGSDAAWILLYLPNMTASAISSALGSQGETLSYVTACSAGSHAVGEAFLKIRNRDLDVVLCGGSDSRLNREGLLAYSMLGALSPSSPNPKVLPFCQGRNGFVPGEGAAAFLLMEADLAASMGIPILAEVAGYGAASDGFRLTDPEPNGQGMEKAMARAIRSAGISPDAIDLINGHGTGTSMNDAAEAAAIRRIFDRPVPVTSNKSQFGHLSAASGAMELAACLASIESQRFTPTVNTKGLEVEEGINLVRESIPAEVSTVLSNSFGFGGQNSTIILRRWKV